MVVMVSFLKCLPLNSVSDAQQCKRVRHFRLFQSSFPHPLQDVMPGQLAIGRNVIRFDTGGTAGHRLEHRLADFHGSCMKFLFYAEGASVAGATLDQIEQGGKRTAQADASAAAVADIEHPLQFMIGRVLVVELRVLPIEWMPCRSLKVTFGSHGYSR